LQTGSLLERFAYRKGAGISNGKDFIKIKGTKGQITHDEVKVDLEND
jgi:solute carrier family 8 (sodium/calcium exchanger)